MSGGFPVRRDPGLLGSQREEAYRRIRSAIVAGDLTSRVLLTERQLVGMFGLGRTPVREALQDLARDGYVEVVPFRGAFVRAFTVADVVELYELRMGLEGIAARLAAERASDAEIEAMFELADEAKAAQGDRSTVQAGRDLHLLVATAGRNGRVVAAIEAMRDHMERARRLGLAGRPFSERAAVQHRAIVEAIAAREPEQAEMRMREHIRYGLERVTSWLSGPGRHE